MTKAVTRQEKTAQFTDTANKAELNSSSGDSSPCTSLGTESSVNSLFKTHSLLKSLLPQTASLPAFGCVRLSSLLLPILCHEEAAAPLHSSLLPAIQSSIGNFRRKCVTIRAGSFRIVFVLSNTLDSDFASPLTSTLHLLPTTSESSTRAKNAQTWNQILKSLAILSWVSLGRSGTSSTASSSVTFRCLAKWSVGPTRIICMLPHTVRQSTTPPRTSLKHPSCKHAAEYVPRPTW